MAELTENQQKVLAAVQNGADSNDTISKQSGVAKGSITAVVNSLIKRDLVSKTEDGKYIETSSVPEGGAPDITETDDGGKDQVSSSDELQVEARDSRITVLIPYLKTEAAGEELKYALRSWEKNFKEEINVVVIGDKEDWFSPDVTHIPHEPHKIKEDCGCPNPSLIRNPQADVAHKLFTAIASGVVKDDFILSNDDIFLLGETHLSDVAFLKAFGKLDKGGKEGGLYNQNTRRTAKVLENSDLPIHRYGTHTPMLINADKLVEVIEKYDALENGLLLTSLYFNEVYPDARPVQVDGTIKDPILASVYRPDVEDHILKSIFAHRKFMNCDAKGWKSIEKPLNIHFPDKSRFEK